MAGGRKFSKAFKSQVVEEYLAGEATQAQLAAPVWCLRQSNLPVEETLCRREVRRGCGIY